jgi:pimeloyl-ACP methyl ester carboxylesterase
MTSLIYAVAAGLLATANAFPTSESSVHERAIGKAGRISNFVDIPSHTELHWTPCYNRFHCANLEVPLDYENPSLGSTVVAWIRLEATNGTGTPADIIYNPGGPGGSGIQSILAGTGDAIMRMSGGKYGVVSFDPRGVNASGIDLTCWPNDPEARDEFDPPNYSTDQEKYAQAVANGKWCTAANEKTTARYAGTVAVVQDIVHFTELQAAQNCNTKPKEALIWYYGVSYGTVIGHTLATLYPDRIGRAIVSANVNSQDHYEGLPDEAVRDADDALLYFFKVCHEAGEKKCSFAGKSTSAKDVEKKFDALLAKLEKDPVLAVQPSFGYPSIVTKASVLQRIFRWLYGPTTSFPLMSAGLVGLEKGNASTWFAAINGRVVAAEASDESLAPSLVEPFNYTEAASAEVLRFVTAIDSAGRYPIKNADDYVKVADEIEKSSKWFGVNYGASNPLINAGWSLMPPKSQLFAGKSSTPYIHHIPETIC